MTLSQRLDYAKEEQRRKWLELSDKVLAMDFCVLWHSAEDCCTVIELQIAG